MGGEEDCPGMVTPSPAGYFPPLPPLMCSAWLAPPPPPGRLLHRWGIHTPLICSALLPPPLAVVQPGCPTLWSVPSIPAQGCAAVTSDSLTGDMGPGQARPGGGRGV